MKATLLFCLATTALAGVSLTAVNAQTSNLNTQTITRQGSTPGTQRDVTVIDAPDGPRSVIVEDDGMPNMDITARAGRFPDNTPVVIVGKIDSKSGDDFILDNPAGQIRIEVGGNLVQSHTGKIGDLSVGASVIVYGRVHQVPGDVVEINTEVVHDDASDRTYLTPLGSQHFAQLSQTQPTKLHYHRL